jgi:hypothetical protein
MVKIILAFQINCQKTVRGLGIGDWGLGIGDLPNPQSPIPNPHLQTKLNIKNEFLI